MKQLLFSGKSSMKINFKGNNMFSLQSTLANNPIPSLQESCEKFLEWTKPLLNQQEFLNTAGIVAKFISPGGEGEKLQHALIGQAEQKKNKSWDCTTWLDLYLAGRYPLPINSNVFYYLKSKLNINHYSQSQIAAALVSSVLQFNLLIESESLTIDRQKGQALCMEQYKNLFSATRMPRKVKDELVISSTKKHIVVLFKGHLFKLKVLDDNGNIHLFSEIEDALQRILHFTVAGQNIGSLTTLPRDEWAESQIILQKLNKKNSEQLKIIEQALFTLSLDENSPELLLDTSKMLLHGDGKDRYFDKSLQFIVFKNGKTGVNFEHTGMDGSVMLKLIGHIYDTIDKYPEDKKQKAIIEPEPLIFELDKRLKTSLVNAKKSFSIAIAATQTRIINFSHFGKSSIKKFALSPDAFVQIALQLAEYKLYGRTTSAYEAIMTRGFLQGRIDVLYTVSMESKAFIENIDNASCDRSTKRALLKKATEKHISRASECRQGMGVHTHFLALINRFENEAKHIGINRLPEIFTDKGYKTLTHNIICTSTTSEYGVELAGYGPVVEDGYGIRYFNRVDSICFNITSRTKNSANLDLMIKYINQALIEMGELMTGS